MTVEEIKNIIENAEFEYRINAKNKNMHRMRR